MHNCYDRSGCRSHDDGNTTDVDAGHKQIEPTTEQTDTQTGCTILLRQGASAYDEAKTYQSSSFDWIG